MTSQEILLNLRFRKTPLSSPSFLAEVVCPVRRSAAGDHTFLSYWDARPTRAEAEAAAAARPDSRHPVVGFATVDIQVGMVEPLEPAVEPEEEEVDPELTAIAEAEGDVELPSAMGCLADGTPIPEVN